MGMTELENEYLELANDKNRFEEIRDKLYFCETKYRDIDTYRCRNFCEEKIYKIEHRLVFVRGMLESRNSLPYPSNRIRIEPSKNKRKLLEERKRELEGILHFFLPPYPKSGGYGSFDKEEAFLEKEIKIVEDKLKEKKHESM